MADLSGDIIAGGYAATSTVYTGRRNLFVMAPGNEHHIGTLVSGSKSKLQRFDEDCDKIVRGLSLLDLHGEMLAALKQAESDQMAYVDRLRRDGPRMALSHNNASRRLEATRAAIAKAERR